MKHKTFLSVLLILLLSVVGTLSDYQLSIAHLNDVHSYFFESTAQGLPCARGISANKSRCLGGIARQVAQIKKIRADEKNAIVLASGDFYLAESFHPLHGWKLASLLVQRLALNATSLGNHDFGLNMLDTAAYIYGLGCPVVVTNLIGRKGSFWNDNVKKSAVLNVNGERIGLLGYISPETRNWAYIGKSLRLEDEIPHLQDEARKLVQKGVNKIIAMGHSSFHMDMVIANAVPEIDVIVGGNSDIFVRTPTGLKVFEMAEEEHELYPSVIRRSTGDALLVHVPQHGRHVGHLKVVFDDEGKVLSYSGKPILLTNAITPDAETDKLVKQSVSQLENNKRWSHIPNNDDVLGHTAVHLDGYGNACRMRECLIGNVLADALVHAFYNHPTGRKIIDGAIWNSGSIRSSILPGAITLRDLTHAVFLGDSVSPQSVTGKELKEMFERSVSKYDVSGIAPPGSFLQVSQMKVEYDLTKRPGKRVASLQIKCKDCNDTGTFANVNDDQNYSIAMPSYFLRGGDGLIGHKGTQIHPDGISDALAIATYMAKSVLKPVLEDRITFKPAESVVESLKNDENKDHPPFRFEFAFLKEMLQDKLDNATVIQRSSVAMRPNNETAVTDRPDVNNGISTTTHQTKPSLTIQDDIIALSNIFYGDQTAKAEQCKTNCIPNAGMPAPEVVNNNSTSADVQSFQTNPDRDHTSVGNGSNATQPTQDVTTPSVANGTNSTISQVYLSQTALDNTSLVNDSTSTQAEGTPKPANGSRSVIPLNIPIHSKQNEEATVLILGVSNKRVKTEVVETRMQDIYDINSTAFSLQPNQVSLDDAFILMENISNEGQKTEVPETSSVKGSTISQVQPLQNTSNGATISVESDFDTTGKTEFLGIPGISIEVNSDIPQAQSPQTNPDGSTTTSANVTKEGKEPEVLGISGVSDGANSTTLPPQPSQSHLDNATNSEENVSSTSLETGGTSSGNDQLDSDHHALTSVGNTTISAANVSKNTEKIEALETSSVGSTSNTPLPHPTETSGNGKSSLTEKASDTNEAALETKVFGRRIISTHPRRVKKTLVGTDHP